MKDPQSSADQAWSLTRTVEVLAHLTQDYEHAQVPAPMSWHCGMHGPG